MTSCQPSAEQEAAWAKHKAECYQRWRDERLAKGVAFLDKGKGVMDRSNRLEAVRKKYGKRFRDDLQSLWTRKQRERQLEDSVSTGE